jgi:hypothetical protein
MIDQPQPKVYITRFIKLCYLPMFPYFLFCFAKKESSKEKRRFFAKGSAGKKIAKRCCLKHYSATWRWLSA